MKNYLIILLNEYINKLLLNMKKSKHFIFLYPLRSYLVD